MAVSNLFRYEILLGLGPDRGLTSVQHDDDSSVGGAASTEQSFVSPLSDWRSPQASIASTLQQQATPDFLDQSLDSIILDNAVAQQSTIGTAPVPAVDPVLFPDGTAQLAADPFTNLFDDPNIDPAWFNIEPDVFFGELGHSCGFIPSAPNIVDEVDKSEAMQSIETSTATPMSLGTGSEMYVKTTSLGVLSQASKLIFSSAMRGRLRSKCTLAQLSQMNESMRWHTSFDILQKQLDHGEHLRLILLSSDS